MSFNTKTKSRAFVATIQEKNMKQAGISDEDIKKPEKVAETFTTLWENSGKNRTCGIAVCLSKDGCYHAHMALYSGNSTTLANVAKILCHSHCEPQLGGKKALKDYLKKSGKYAEKDEQVLYTLGLNNIQDNQGQRSDLEQIAYLIDEGWTPREIMELNFSYRKYERMIKSAYIDKRIAETPLIKDMWVEWHCGQSGTGKTHEYIKLCEKYSPNDIYMCTDLKDGGLDLYIQSGAPPILFIDEFKGDMRFSNFLTILDKYSRNQTHCRYANTYNLWQQVIITSAYPPEQIYNIMVSDNNRHTDTYYQLLRRLSVIVYHYRHNGEYKTFSIPADEYKGYNDLVKKSEATKYY